jgi:hypothetical protein
VEVADSSPQNGVEASVHANLRERFADFWRNRELKLYELQVVFHRTGSLRGQARKLRRIIDERQMNKFGAPVLTA